MSTSLVSSQVLWTDEAFAKAEGEWQSEVLQSPDSLSCYSPVSLQAKMGGIICSIP